MLQQCFHVLNKVNDPSTQCVSLYLDVTDVLTSSLRMLSAFLNSSSRSVSFLTLGQNIFNLPLLVTDFHLFVIF